MLYSLLFYFAFNHFYGKEMPTACSLMGGLIDHTRKKKEKMSIMRVESRTPVTIVKKWKLSKIK